MSTADLMPASATSTPVSASKAVSTTPPNASVSPSPSKIPFAKPSSPSASTSKGPASSATTSTSAPKRSRPPMLVLGETNKGSSPPSNTNFANINLASLNRNTATTTTTLSATPSSAIFPSIRTPKDVVLQDLTVQCISPGLPTFPATIRDAMAKSKSIQEAQRKIIAQRMKDNGSVTGSNISEGKPFSGSDDENDIDLEPSSEDINNPSKPSKSPTAHAEPLRTANSHANERDETESNKVSNSANSANNANFNSVPSNNANPETSFSTTLPNHKTSSRDSPSAANKDSQAADDNVTVTIEHSSKALNDSSKLSESSSQSKASSLPKSSSTPKPLNLSAEKSSKQIICSGDLIIEAVPTPTLPSLPQFNKRDISSMKATTKRAPPPKNIKVTGFDSENPSIRSAPLYREPAPFSPYSLSKIPGYQAFYLNQALSTQPPQKQAQATGLSGASASNTTPSSGNSIPAVLNPQQHTARPVYANGAMMSPIYPTANGVASSSVAAAALGYAGTPTAPYYYTRPQYAAATGQYGGLTGAGNALTALGGSVNGLQPGLTSVAASNFYRDPRMVPLYVSGRPTIPPMTASAANWTGRTFRSHQINKKVQEEDEDEEEEEDDGRDPEDRALSDDEADSPKKNTKKSSKRASPSKDDEDDNLDDVEQNAISEEDERLAQPKKRRLNDSTLEAASKVLPIGTALTNGDMYDIASEAIIGAASGTMSYNSALYESLRNLKSNGQANKQAKGRLHSANRTEEGLKEENLKKQRFMELCSELWDLVRS